LGAFFDLLFAIPIAIIEGIMKPITDKITAELNKLVSGIMNSLPQPPAFPAEFLNFKLPLADEDMNFECHGGWCNSLEVSLIKALKR